MGAHAARRPVFFLGVKFRTYHAGQGIWELVKKCRNGHFGHFRQTNTKELFWVMSGPKACCASVLALVLFPSEQRARCCGNPFSRKAPRLRLQSHCCSLAFSAAFVTCPFLGLRGVDFKKAFRSRHALFMYCVPASQGSPFRICGLAPSSRTAFRRAAARRASGKK